MSVIYPATFRKMLKASKARSQIAAFSISEPRRGYGYVEETGTDTPVFWDVTLRLTKCEAQQFMLWWVVDTRRGCEEVVLPIGTEFGVIAHTGRFLDEWAASEDGEVREYRNRFMARAMVIPADAITAWSGSVTTIPAQDVFAGVAFSLDLTSYWPAGVGPYSWAITSGVLPPGLTLNSTTGVVSGTTTVSDSAWTVTIEREDVYCVEKPGNPITFNVYSTSAVTVMLRGEGTEGGTTFVDSSISPKTVTVAGSATTSSSVGVVAGSRAIKITGTGATKGVTLASGSEHALGTGAWTVECWFTLAAIDSNSRDIFYIRSDSLTHLIRVRVAPHIGDAWVHYQITHSGSGVSGVSSSGSLSALTSYHLCVMRDGGELRVFLNGASIASMDAGTAPADTIDLVGTWTIGGPTGLDGAVDEFRFTKKRVYSMAGFTVPAAPLSAYIAP